MQHALQSRAWSALAFVQYFVLNIDVATIATALVSQLLEVRDERRLLKLQRDLASTKLLIIDELGYVPLSSTGAEPLFETFSQRYERGSTIVTSNLPFEDWTSVFGSERLAGRCSTGSPTTSVSSP
jgi:DNA replication protein DnaC